MLPRPLAIWLLLIVLPKCEQQRNVGEPPPPPLSSKLKLDLLLDKLNKDNNDYEFSDAFFGDEHGITDVEPSENDSRAEILVSYLGAVNQFSQWNVPDGERRELRLEPEEGLYRLVTSFASAKSDVDEFGTLLKAQCLGAKVAPMEGEGTPLGERNIA